MLPQCRQIVMLHVLMTLLLRSAAAAAFAAVDDAPLPRFVVLGGTQRSAQLRISVLSARALRVETAQGDVNAPAFEDRPSLTFPSREGLPVPHYSTSHAAGSTVWTVTTSALMLRYDTAQLGKPKPGDAARAGAPLGCAALNISLRAPTGVGTSWWCPGSTYQRPGASPFWPDEQLDEWRDIVHGPTGNLNGSLDSTDCYHGAIPCLSVYGVRQQAGLFSREGWAIVDDSKTAVVLNSTWHDRWSQRGRRSGAMDTYFFGWGSDFKGGMKEFTRLAGRIPIMPWRAHGVWWSRYWPYNETGIKDVVENYESHALPLNMLVMDVDWHDRPGSTSIDIGCFWDTTPPNGAALHEQCANGYGGYNWNTSLFPSPTSFQQWVHEERSLQLMLNLHSQCGIDKCQHKYAEVLQANGMPSPSTGWNQTIQCAITDPNYVKTLYEFVLDDGDNAGVDFWWEDYGVDFHSTKENSSDPLSTHVDRCDEPNVGGHCTRCLADPVEDQPALWSAYVRVQAEEAKGKRGMTLGIYGGLGHHRYPLVGSGDTYESYDTLSYEVYLSISSANVGVAWTHDLGGFMPACEYGTTFGDGQTCDSDYSGPLYRHDEEIFLRNLQYGAWSSIFRTHCSHCDPRIWMYESYELLAQPMRLRNQLQPYIYSAAFAAYETGLLLVHPLYWDWPNEQEAYALSEFGSSKKPLQYSFGSDFVVAPITAKAAADGRITWPLWVPPGDWIEWGTGAPRTGPATYSRDYTLEETPVLVRAGAIVPMKEFEDQHSLAPNRLVLTAMWQAKARGSTVVYQDEGDNLGYQSGEYTLLTIALQCGVTSNISSASETANGTVPTATKLTMTPSGNGYPGAPTTVRYLAKFRGAPPGVTSVSCAGCVAAKPGAELRHWYEPPEKRGAGRMFVVETPPQPSTAALSLSFA